LLTTPPHPAFIQYPGSFFVFEGIDGTGKSTQCRLLAEALTSRGYAVVQTREPTDGMWGRKIRELANKGIRNDPAYELELFVRDRKQHIAQLILPALMRKQIVIQDRYFLSSVAYQGCRGLDPKAILQQHLEFAPLPTRTFLIEISPLVALERIQQYRNASLDAFETLTNLQACADIFQDIELPGLIRIDGLPQPQQIHQVVMSEINKIFQ
jgi:dTMP kinase